IRRVSYGRSGSCCCKTRERHALPSWQMSLKRVIDVVISGVVLLISAPLFGLVAVLVVWDSGFPVFFRQERLGRHFKPFRILKFRSMRSSQGGPKVTVSGDSRVTTVGK